MPSSAGVFGDTGEMGETGVPAGDALSERFICRDG